MITRTMVNLAGFATVCQSVRAGVANLRAFFVFDKSDFKGSFITFEVHFVLVLCLCLVFFILRKIPQRMVSSGRSRLI